MGANFSKVKNAAYNKLSMLTMLKLHKLHFLISEENPESKDNETNEPTLVDTGNHTKILFIDIESR